MSNICQTCRKCFQYPYQLARHKKKKNKCKLPEYIEHTIEEKIKDLEQVVESQLEVISEQGEQISQQEKKIGELENLFKSNDSTLQKYNCTYCCKTFSRLDSFDRHVKQKRCKAKNDNVTIYERELGIKVPETEPLTCRFCKVLFSTQPSYSRHVNGECKEKLKYELDLQSKVLSNRKELATAKVAINGNQNKNYSDNTTTNSHNTVNNNIYLPPMNAFGNENLDYITTKMLIKQIELCKDFSDITETVKTFTQLIHAHPAHPENHNVLIKGNNSAFSEIFNGENMEKVNTIGVQDKILHNVGRLLLDKKTEYCEEYDKKDKKMPKKIETKLIKLEEAVDDNINSELFKENVGESTRNLTAYRNTVKGAIISSKDSIEYTQNLIAANE
jgi:uncharacterized C2H2 Zn-finger protein